MIGLRRVPVVKRVGLLAGLIGVCCASALHAQGGVAAGPARSLWLLTTTGEYGYESNIVYAAAPDAVSDFLARLNTSLRVVRARARTTLEMQASGSALFYQRSKPLNALAYDVSGTGTRRISAATAGSATVYYRNLLTNQGLVTGPGSLLLRRAIQRSIGGSFTLGRRVSAFTNAGLSGSYTNVTFDTPGLIPGAAFTGLAAVRHQFRRAGTAGVLLAMEEGSAQGSPLRAQSASGEWGSVVKKVRLQITAGVTRSATGPVARYLMTGAALVGDSIGPGSFSAGYSRSASQAFGIGQLLVTDGFTSSYDFQARRGNFVTVSGFIGESRLSTGVGTALKSSGVSAGFRRVVQSGLTVGGGASYRQRRDIVQASGYGVSLGAGYTMPSR